VFCSEFFSAGIREIKIRSKIKSMIGVGEALPPFFGGERLGFAAFRTGDFAWFHSGSVTPRLRVAANESGWSESGFVPYDCWVVGMEGEGDNRIMGRGQNDDGLIVTGGNGANGGPAGRASILTEANEGNEGLLEGQPTFNR
jgi:hypothetical protein